MVRKCEQFRILILALVLCAAGAQCDPPMPDACKNFFSLPSIERERQFPTYSLEKQLSLNRCGLNLRPPTTVYAIYIAERGEAVIPHLMEKLDGEKDELSQYAIINVFQVMSAKGHLRNRPDVISRIRQVIARMESPGIRAMAEKDLNEIEKNNRS